MLAAVYSSKFRPTGIRLALCVHLLWLLAFESFWVSGTYAADAARQSEPKGKGDVPAEEFAPSDCLLGSWIWSDQTFDGQNCHLWRAFEIPKGSVISNGRLLITVDDRYTLLLDGRVLGRGYAWQHLDEYDVTDLLNAGHHVIAIQGWNEHDRAGVMFGLFIAFANGQHIAIRSDDGWRVVPATRRHWEIMTSPLPDWPRAKVMAKFLSPPWWTVLPSVVPHPLDKPVLTPFWQTGWFQITLLSFCAIVVMICLQLMARLAFHRKGQRLLGLERARIARDIHDDLGAGLTQLVLLGEVVRNEVVSDFKGRREIDEICEKARELSRNLAEILWAVNSRHDTLPDFATHTFKYAQAFLEATPIRCRLDVEPDLSAAAFDLPIRRNLFLAVKEAIHNAAKHSKATELFLRVRQWKEGVQVLVEDNGVGFNLDQIDSERNGLRNMKQRMREIGGRCNISSSKDGGCRIEFSIPVIHGLGHSSCWEMLFGRSKPLTRKDADPEVSNV